MLTRKMFYQFLSFCINMQKIRKFHWFVLEIYSWLKNPALCLTEHFGPYLKNKSLPKILNLHKNTEKNTNFHWTNSVNINNQILNKLKKPCFWPIFGPFSRFWRQERFLCEIRICQAQLHTGAYCYAKI